MIDLASVYLNLHRITVITCFANGGKRNIDINLLIFQYLGVFFTSIH